MGCYRFQRMGVARLGLVTLGLLAVTYGQKPDPPKETTATGTNSLVVRTSEVKARYSKRLLGLPGVVGHGVALSKKASPKPVIEVYVSRDLSETERKLFPKDLEGIDLVIVKTGSVRALSGSRREEIDTRKQLDEDSPVHEPNPSRDKAQP